MVENDFEKLIEMRKRWVDVTQENEFNIESILSGLYDDPSHFVYEILQNAEDVRAKTVRFNLLSDKLEIWHDGDDFSYDNVDGITGIGNTTKKGDLNAIGKFGVGFKSVFAVTKSPCVFSGQYNFKIQKFVLPITITRKYDGDGTYIIIPFNHPNRTKEDVFKIIKHRLLEIGLETLLFLKNIQNIECNVNSNLEGVYKKELITGPNVFERKNGDNNSNRVNSIEPNLNGKYKKVKLTYSKENNILKQEKWLVLDRRLNDDKNLKIEIAFIIGNDDKGNEIILPTERGKLAVFFLTAIETGLKFIIQGPYKTTPARDNIPFNDEWNKSLIEQTAELVGDSLHIIKEIGLLNVDFLKVIPLKKTQIKDSLSPIFEKVKTELNSDDELLPIDNGKYTSAKDALLARGSGLRPLLSNEQLELLFERKNWLDSEITDKSQELMEYLKNELEIPEIVPNKFARSLDASFLKEQTDEWIIEFYKFSRDHPDLLKEGGILRNKPIIRLENNQHVLPLKDQAYLPSKNEDINKIDLPFIKNVIASNPEANTFLTSLEFKEPDCIAGILNKILPQYTGENGVPKIKFDDHIQHIGFLFRTLKESPDGDRKRKLLDKIKDTAILKCRNIASNEVVYRSPSNGIYLGETYTNNKDVEIFFEMNNQIWLLHDYYKDILIDIDIIKSVGCKTGVSTLYIKENLDTHVTLKGKMSGKYKIYIRGLNGFDPNCCIEGLEHALKNITITRAKIIWDVLISNENYKRICGSIEESSKLDFSDGGYHYDLDEKSSYMGELLASYAWLLDKTGNYCKPSNIILTGLHDDFDIACLEAKKIGEKLGFRTPVKQQLLEQLPEKERALYELITEASQKGFETNITNFINKLFEESKTTVKRESLEDISKTFENSLSSETTNDTKSSNNQSNNWSGSTPDEEDTIEDNYETNLHQNLDDTSLITEFKIVKTSKIVSTNDTHIDGKEFLEEQYNGHCQICNTRLDLGNGKPYFPLTHISDRKHEHVWSDEVWNILCLCPNCHALYKHGRNNNLNNIKEIALLASKNDIAPEPIDEKNGDFYIANIKLAGQEKQIYYTPEHLRKTSVIVKNIMPIH